MCSNPFQDKHIYILLHRVTAPVPKQALEPILCVAAPRHHSTLFQLQEPLVEACCDLASQRQFDLVFAHVCIMLPEMFPVKQCYTFLK